MEDPLINIIMTEYDERVERQRILLEAEEWANGMCPYPQTDSMWYDTRPRH